jgi:3-methyladenine DNA glycosylase AlkC
MRAEAFFEEEFMAELLKNMINKQVVNQIADQISKHDPKFSPDEFRRLVLSSSWASLELKQRIRCIVNALGATVSGNYRAQIRTLKKVAPAFSGLKGLAFPDFVEVFGANDFSTSIDALKEFTPHSSSEFAIRPFILRNSKHVMPILLEWSKDRNDHVRRLASEGCRPRLPWSFPLREFIENPTAVIKILENLKDDPSLYVRKSVANNLNDISKEHPELVLSIAKKWIGKTDNTDWILKHALRTLLKNGNQKALALFGLGKVKNVHVSKLVLSKNAYAIGSELEFSAKIHNKNSKPISLRLEYAIHYLTKNGTHSKKVFKLSERLCSPGLIDVRRRHSLKQRTTRKHNPGPHQLDIIVNGEIHLSRKFVLE